MRWFLMSEVPCSDMVGAVNLGDEARVGLRILVYLVIYDSG